MTRLPWWRIFARLKRIEAAVFLPEPGPPTYQSPSYVDPTFAEDGHGVEREPHRRARLTKEHT